MAIPQQGSNGIIPERENKSGRRITWLMRIFVSLLILHVLSAFILYATFLNSQESHVSTDYKFEENFNPLSVKKILASNAPVIFYGTAYKEKRTAELVCQAIESGFRFIDTAARPGYYFEEGVGKGWKSCAKKHGITRQDIFLQTAFTPWFSILPHVNIGQIPDGAPFLKDDALHVQLAKSFEKSLKNLQTEYVDSFLIQAPLATHEETMIVYRNIEALRHRGKVHHIGLSNFYDLNEVKAIYNEAIVKPSIIQNRFYEISGFDVGIRKFCKEKGIQYQTVWTINSNRQEIHSRDVYRLAEKKVYMTPETLMYAYVLQLGLSPVSGTMQKKHMDLDVETMKRIYAGEKLLNEEEMAMFTKNLKVPEK